MTYYPFQDWLCLMAGWSNPANDNLLYANENIRICPAPDFSPTHKKRGDGQIPAFGCGDAHSEVGYWGDDEA